MRELHSRCEFIFNGFWDRPVSLSAANAHLKLHYIIEISFWKHLLKNFFLIFFFFWIQQIVYKIIIIIVIPTMSTTTTAEMLIAVFTKKMICNWVLLVFRTRVPTRQWFLQNQISSGKESNFQCFWCHGFWKAESDSNWALLLLLSIMQTHCPLCCQLTVCCLHHSAHLT